MADMKFYGWRDSSVRLTGRWDRTDDRCAETTNPGAYFELAFCGDMLLLVFDTGRNIEHGMPHLYISVDGGAFTESKLCERIRIVVPDGGTETHVCRVIYKSALEAVFRWRAPVHNTVSFCGYSAKGAGVLAPDTRRTVEFVGDSITEGVFTDADYAKAPAKDVDEENRVFQDDATATYAWLTAEKLGLRPVICAFGAVGVTRPGKGRVPEAPVSYPYNFEGSPISHTPVDIVVINHGANDRQHADIYLEKYEETLLLLRKHNPGALIVSLSPFVGAFDGELAKFIPEYNARHGDCVAFISSAGWIPAAPLHPLRDGHRTVAEHLAAELAKII